MVRPQHYEVSYRINPWMDPDVPVDWGKAQKQWENLREVLGQVSGAEVHSIDQREGLPDMVFCADCGVAFGKLWIKSNFRYPQRQSEPHHHEPWFRDRGYEIIELPREIYLEGQGDIIFWARSASLNPAKRGGRGVFLSGWGFRTDLLAHKLLEKITGVPVVSLRLINPYFYHLNTALLPLDHETAAFYPGAFGEDSQIALKNLFSRLIAVSEEEARSFVLCSLAIGKKIIGTGKGNLLRDLGFEHIPLDLSEFQKGGGGAACLVFQIPD